VDENPFAELEQEVHRQDMEAKAAAIISRARKQFILGREASHVFFASVAVRMETLPDWSVETAATDGRQILYNPEWFGALSAEHARAVLAHEVLHVAYKHMCRCQGKDFKRWNIATDLAINPILVEAGFSLPAGGLMPGQGTYAKLPIGKSAEWYYDNLPQEEGQDNQEGQEEGQGQGQGQGEQDPGKMGSVKQPGDGSQAAAAQAEAEAHEIIAQASQAAKGRGQLPSGLARAVEQSLMPKADWKETLRAFVSRQSRNDYSWSRPNRRYIAQGLYLPGLHSEELGDVVCAIDTSGSIDGKTLDVFAGELQGIMDSFPEAQMTIVYHDSMVQHVQHWAASNGPLVLEPRGGGGTDHRPVFDWIGQNGEIPTCLVCLTDMDSIFPDKAPGYPVLWAAVGARNPRAPFGQVMEVE
jgi:predicted metal-dependent peptidase